MHVGSWIPASYDPELRLIFQGTSVTSPAPKFMLGGVENAHLYHNSTLAIDVETGEIRWYYQHLNDHWDLDHPFERLLVDTAVAPDPEAVSWINPRIQPGEVRKVVTGVPGKTGVVYTLDRETGEFLWATPTVSQNVINDIDGATGAVTENAEVTFTALGQEVLACPTWAGGKDWEAGAYSPLTNTMYMPLRNTCARMLATDDVRSERARALTAGGQGGLEIYALAARHQITPGEEPARHHPRGVGRDGEDGVAARAARGHHVGHGDRRGAGLRRRRQRPVPRPRPGDRRGAVGDQPRLARRRLPHHLRRRRPPVRGHQHRPPAAASTSG